MENKLILIIVFLFMFLSELRQSLGKRRYYDNNAEDNFLLGSYNDAEEKHAEDFYDKYYDDYFSDDDVDYASEQFNGNKNCADEGKLYKTSQTHPEHCFSTHAYDQQDGFKSCAVGASRMLKKKCSKNAGVESSGNMTYCMARGTATCCFSQPKCHMNLEGKYKHWERCLCKYLWYGLDTMADFIAIKTKYKMCFKTRARKTGPCEGACEQLQEGEFAKNCSKEVDGKKGVFKCCIISRNKGCDVCNYCCVLPICTRQLMNGYTITDYDIEVPLVKTNLTNKGIPMIKREDDSIIDYNVRELFCVQPKLKKGKHLYYNMTEYRAATTLEEMKKLENTAFTPYQGSYYDIFNPKDRLKFKTETGPKMDAKINGYDYCFKLQTNRKKTKCAKKCKQLEKQTFAKKCNKKKYSVFKCCINRIDLDLVERRQMRGMGKLNKTVTRICGNGTCNYCCITAVCSTLHDGKITNTFRTPQKTVLQTPEYRYAKCFVPIDKFNNLYWSTFNITEYKAAYTEDMLCHVTHKLDWTLSKEDMKKIPTKSKIKKKCDKMKEKRNKRKHKKKYKNIPKRKRGYLDKPKRGKKKSGQSPKWKQKKKYKNIPKRKRRNLDKPKQGKKKYGQSQKRKQKKKYKNLPKLKKKKSGQSQTRKKKSG